jgi:hypothetical protein
MSMTSTTTPGPSSVREESERTVYVIELRELGAFAFEARNEVDAENLARSHWFVQAIDRFCSGRFGTANADSHLRSATDEEASAFQDLADEFADAASSFLVAHLSGGATTHLGTRLQGSPDAPRSA